MTYKQIEASRERRLWLGQVIIPTVTTVATLLAIPEVRSTIANKARNVKMSIKQKFKKD